MAQKRIRFFDVFVIGFAMFAVFFGAGNLIFPPFLGKTSGHGWFLGFLCFVLADVGLAILTMLVLVRRQDAGEGELLSGLGRIPAKIISVTVMLCVGPLLCIPRTGATTYEMAVAPLLPEVPAWLFSLLFFAVVFLLTLRSSSVVDVIGKVLTPLLLITLAVLCVKGVVGPIGEIAEAPPVRRVMKDGFLAGYQTMDVLGAMVMVLMVSGAAARKGYRAPRAKFRVIVFSSLIAAACLFAVYCGLTYLGATTSQLAPEGVNQTGLVVLVTELLLQRAGVYLLALIVFFACLTTAVGLVSSTAEYFTKLLRRVPYPIVTAVMCLSGVLIGTVGISAIIRFASPILNVMYPLLLTQILVSLVPPLRRRPYACRGAALGALLVCVIDTACNLGLPFGFIKQLPLARLGFAWVPFAVLGCLIGALLPRQGRTQTEQPAPVGTANDSEADGEGKQEITTIVGVLPQLLPGKKN